MKSIARARPPKASKPWATLVPVATAIADRVRAHCRRSVFTPVSFSQVKEGATFWWEGECFIKETEALIFGQVAPGKFAPMARPFAIDQTVEI